MKELRTVKILNQYVEEIPPGTGNNYFAYSQWRITTECFSCTIKEVMPNEYLCSICSKINNGNYTVSRADSLEKAAYQINLAIKTICSEIVNFANLEV